MKLFTSCRFFPHYYDSRVWPFSRFNHTHRNDYMCRLCTLLIFLVLLKIMVGTNTSNMGPIYVIVRDRTWSYVIERTDLTPLTDMVHILCNPHMLAVMVTLSGCFKFNKSQWVNTIHNKACCGFQHLCSIVTQYYTATKYTVYMISVTQYVVVAIRLI